MATLPKNVNRSTFEAVKSTNELSEGDTSKVFTRAREQKISLADAIKSIQGGQDTDTVTNPPEPMRVSDPDSQDTEATRSSQSILDANAESKLAGIEARRQERLEESRRELEEERERRTDLAEEAVGIIEDLPSQESVVREEREKLGVPQELERQRMILDEIRGLRQQAIDLEQQRGEALSTSEGRKAPIGFIRGEQARVQAQFDRRIATVSKRVGAEAAVLQASQGLVQQARGLVSDIVKASTFDTEMELKRVSILMEENAAQISELDTEIQNDLKLTQQHWQNRLAEERKEKESVVNLMISNPDAGISVDDSLEEASEKASTVQQGQDIEKLVSVALESGATEDVIQSVRGSETISEARDVLARSGIFRQTTQTTDRGTEKERAIDEAIASLSQAVDEKTGTVSFDAYMNTRARVALDSNDFDQRFAEFLNESDKTALQELRTEFAIESLIE